MSTMTTSELREFINKQIEGSDLREVIERQIRKMGEGRDGETRALIHAMMSGEGDADPGRAERAMALPQMLRAVAASKGDPERAASWARKNNCLGSVVKALSTSDGSAGGFLVPVDFSQDIVEYLRPMVAVRKLNPTVISMPSGTTRIPKIVTGATASYIGESQNIGVTQQVFGQLTLSFLKLAALVPISNDLVRYSSPSIDAVVRDDVVRAMAARENQAFLRDDGTANTPKGLRYRINSANVLTMSGTDVLTSIVTDLGRLILQLEQANVPFTRPGWIMAPRTRHRLMTLLNVNSAFVFRPEMLGGTLWGYPFAVSTAVPANLGAGGNESEVYLCDFADVVIGESQSLIVDASTEASYYDGANTQSAYSRDETVVRAILEEDINMRRDISGTVLTAVTWGA